MSLCGKIKRRRRLLSFPDDRTKLTDLSEWLQYKLAPPTSPAVFKTARVRLFATHSHHPLVVSICHHLAKIIVLYLPRPLGYDCNDFGLTTFSSHIVHELTLVHTLALLRTWPCTLSYGVFSYTQPHTHTHTHTHTHSCTAYLHTPVTHVANTCLMMVQTLSLTNIVMHMHSIQFNCTCACLYRPLILFKFVYQALSCLQG